MYELMDWLRAQLQTNGFMAGGVITVLFGAILAFCRQLPGQLWSAIMSHTLVSATILENSNAYTWFEMWFEQQPAGQRSRRVLVRTQAVDPASPIKSTSPQLSHSSGRSGRQTVVYMFSPEPGTHWFRYRKTWVRLVHSEEKRGEGMAAHTQKQYRLTAWSLNRYMLREMLEEIRQHVMPAQEPCTLVYSSTFGDWRSAQQIRLRTLKDVILPAAQKQQIQQDLTNFIERRQWYRDRHIPYRRGYRLIGPPGTGKTSLIAAIAGELGLSICQLNLNDPSLNDNQVRHLFATIEDVAGSNALLVLEDFDSVFCGREPVRAKSELSFSNLINTLDGLASRDGLITIMTTNRPEVMDEALVREGRIDVTYELGYACYEQAVEIFLRFFPGEVTEAERFAANVENADRPYSMAALQGWLVRHANGSAAEAAVIDNSDQPETFAQLPLPELAVTE